MINMTVLKTKANRISNAVMRGLAPIEKKLCNAKVAATAALIAADTAGMAALCAPTGNIETIVNTVGKIIFGFIWFLGAIQLVMGIVSAVKSATDEDAGGDQNGISKGMKKAIAGILLIVGPAAILGLVGLNPLTLGTDLFSGL